MLQPFKGCLGPLWDYVALSWASESLPRANPNWYLAPGRLGTRRVKGGGWHFFSDSGWTFICRYGSPWGEEKAGFGAQPRDFDAILPCPGDINNNTEHFGASSFKMLLRNPIPHPILAPRGLFAERVKGGVCILKKFQAIHLYVYINGHMKCVKKPRYL